MSEWTAQDAMAAAVPGQATSNPPVLLRQAREGAGLHIAALAAALKVPVKKLEALEAGRYGELPDMVFARALASSACRHLKVDPAPILEQIPASVTPQLGDSGMAINTPFKAASGGVPANPVGWLSRPAVLAAIALMLGALVLVFLPNMSTPPEPVAEGPAAEAAPAPSGVINSLPVEAAPAAVAELAPSLASLPDAASASVSAPSASTSTLAGAVPAAPVASADAVAAEPGDASKLLTIRATGDSWVEVTNGTGVVVIQRMLRTGDMVDFSAAPPYAVVVGRVDNAEVLVRGRLFDAAPFARNGVARFEVK